MSSSSFEAARVCQCCTVPSLAHPSSCTRRGSLCLCVALVALFDLVPKAWLLGSTEEVVHQTSSFLPSTRNDASLAPLLRKHCDKQALFARYSRNGRGGLGWDGMTPPATQRSLTSQDSPSCLGQEKHPSFLGPPPRTHAFIHCLWNFPGSPHRLRSRPSSPLPCPPPTHHTTPQPAPSNTHTPTSNNE